MTGDLMPDTGGMVSNGVDKITLRGSITFR